MALYEDYLPYAIALDVESKWTEYFNAHIPEATANYSPRWAHGATAVAAGASMCAAISTGITTATSATVGSSSGGGFFGGGGGGW